MQSVRTGSKPWLLTIALLAVLLATGLPCPLHAQAGVDPATAAATLDTYVAALTSARTMLDTTDDEARALAAARAELAPFAAVQLPGGDVMLLKPILGDAAEPLTRSAAQTRIDTTLEQLRLAAGDQTASRLALLEKVWQQREFAQGETLAERFLRWLAEFLDRLVPDLRPNPAAQTVSNDVAALAGWVIAGLGVLALGWLFSLWLRQLLGRFVADATVAAASAGDDLPRTPAEARTRAEAMARSGAYRDAVRNLYLAALLTLENRRLVVVDRSLTNREVLAQVPDEDVIRPYLRPVVDTFDAVWYGIQEPDAATFADYSAQIDGLESAAATAPETGSA